MIVTEDNGTGTSTIKLNELPLLPSPGSILEVTAIWLGPTQEQIEKKANIV